MMEPAHERLGVISLTLTDTISGHERRGRAMRVGGARPLLTDSDGTVPGRQRSARIIGQERADPAVMESAVVGEE